MAAKNVKSENLKKYLAHLKSIGEENLVPPKTDPSKLNDLMKELATEGMALLKQEEKAKLPPVAVKPPCEKKKLEQVLAATSTNPYVRARNKVLMDLPEDRRKRIEEMEQAGKIDNPVYKEFVQMVTELGDKFST